METVKFKNPVIMDVKSLIMVQARELIVCRLSVTGQGTLGQQLEITNCPSVSVGYFSGEHLQHLQLTLLYDD